MGLDMYLVRKLHGEDEEEDVGYWRKANAIHGWFDRHIDGGIEDCMNYPVSKEMLEKLKSDCEAVLENSTMQPGKIKTGSRLINGKWEDTFADGELISDNHYAEMIMPVTSGFFFGSQQYGSWYIDDLKDTIKIVEDVLRTTDFDEEEIFYRAWW